MVVRSNGPFCSLQVATFACRGDHDYEMSVTLVIGLGSRCFLPEFPVPGQVSQPVASTAAVGLGRWFRRLSLATVSSASVAGFPALPDTDTRLNPLDSLSAYPPRPAFDRELRTKAPADFSLDYVVGSLSVLMRTTITSQGAPCSTAFAVEPNSNPSPCRPWVPMTIVSTPTFAA